MRSIGGVRLGSIAGIEIRADWSLLIIFALITAALATGLFPEWHPRWSIADYWLTALAAAVLFFTSVLVHELSHALVGRVRGVQIRRITLFIFGGVAQMENEPPSWRAELAMAIVGPITSLVIGVVCVGLVALMTGGMPIDPNNPKPGLAALGPLPSLLLWLGPVNILLAVFNIVPGFPLDGGRVLRAVLWGATGRLDLATRWASRTGQGFAWLLMASGFAMLLGLHLPLFGGGFVNGLWLIFIGWFLNNAAMLSYQQLLVRRSLEDVPVRRLMQTQFVRIDPGMPVATLVGELVMGSGQRAFPVEAHGRLLGIVSLRDLQKRTRAQWAQTSVSEVMTPAAALAVLTPEQDGLAALELIASRGVSQLPVVQHGELLGLIRREDILKWLSLHATDEAGMAPAT
jgi:Zn-dependent protease/CBS domain-containing protein